MLWPARCSLILLAFSIAAGMDISFPVPAAKKRTVCKGTQFQAAECPNLEPCGDCQDCEISEWDSWGHCECNGLQLRTRIVHTPNNECGKPCDGVLTGTRACNPTCKASEPTNCEFEDWSEWSHCKSSTDQKSRSRGIQQAAANGGNECLGGMEEIEPCGEPKPAKECQLSDWAPWTDCSRSCDSGQRTRMRHVTQHARGGGTPCTGELMEIMHCNEKSCFEGQTCTFSPWSEWNGCDMRSMTQKVRVREIKTANANCEGKLEEIAACPRDIVPSEDCKLSGWSTWTKCDKTCGGGQQYQQRHEISPPLHGGSCNMSSLRRTQPCNEQECVHPGKKDCEFGSWNPWSNCSASCGVGEMSRQRDISQKAENGGDGCIGILIEVTPCEAEPCEKIDCNWGNWGKWAECSCSCGPGFTTRERQIAVAPLNGGALCAPEDRQEMGSCNSQPCESPVCKDAKWDEWQEWSLCSVTCAAGFQTHKRLLASEATQCGSPVNGSAVEYRSCDAGPCADDRDCIWSAWGKWSGCSSDCYGTRERNRNIEVYKVGSGKSCVGPLKVVEPCNPGVQGNPPIFLKAPVGCDAKKKPVDCIIGSWGTWSPCTAECGGGQTQRVRKILTPNANGGSPCSGEEGRPLALMHVTSCNETKCEGVCEDCKWTDWSGWSDCNQGGQQLRHRDIRQTANFCGRPCQKEASRQVTNCTLEKERPMFCSWTQWSTDADCSATCGAASKLRTRNMKVTWDEFDSLFRTGDESLCHGMQTETLHCDYEECPETCNATDCRFGEWHDWDHPTCTGLCARTRTVEIMNNECGTPCNGTLMATKACPNGKHVKECREKLDCEWGRWGSWSNCRSPLDYKRRERSIERESKNNGLACTGPAVQVEPCQPMEKIEVIDCQTSDWSEWTPCSVTCQSGTQKRSRFIKLAAQNGGVPCDAELTQVVGCVATGDGCGGPVQDVDCEFDHWAEWSSCKDGQQERSRDLLKAAQGKGKPCTGEFVETAGCVEVPMDCVMSEWTAWVECDKTCEGGQKTRQRQVHRHPRNGGKDCEADLVQVMPCNEIPCSEKLDCEFDLWSEWSDCDASCDWGQRKRERKIKHEAIDGGSGCAGQTAQTRGCKTSSCDANSVDCVWGDWHSWERCPVACGGGQRNRHRKVVTSPKGTGKLCEPLTSEEVEPCGTGSCQECVDGVWSDWAAWADCTVTCGGGKTERKRSVTTAANECGIPVHGATTEVKPCNSEQCVSDNKDCEFGEWDEWNDCTCDCWGKQERRRQVEHLGKGHGAFCEGALNEYRPCNPLEGEMPSAECGPPESQDCVMSEWTDWLACSSTCGTGRRQRSRKIDTHPFAGGKDCNGGLVAFGTCDAGPCEGAESIHNCSWTGWSDWSNCDSGNNQRDRHRQMHVPTAGGVPCEVGPVEEKAPCASVVAELAYCGWKDWEDWEECSQTCGHGRRIRERSLDASSTPPVPERLYEDSHMENQKLQEHMAGLHNGRIQKLIAAFASGALSLVALNSGLRLFRRTPDAAHADAEGVAVE